MVVILVLMQQIGSFDWDFIISFIDQPQIIKKILKYLGLWEEELSRGPPTQTDVPDEIVYVPIEDTGWEQYQNPDFSG